MTSATTLADQQRPAGGKSDVPHGGVVANGDGVATRRDLVAMHNSLLKVIQARRPAGGDVAPDTAIAKMQARLAELGESVMRMESLLAVNMRAEVQKAVSDVAGPQAVLRAAAGPRRLSRLVFLSLLVNLVLGVAVLVLAVPELSHRITAGLLPGLAGVLDLPAQLATLVW